MKCNIVLAFHSLHFFHASILNQKGKHGSQRPTISGSLPFTLAKSLTDLSQTKDSSHPSVPPVGSSTARKVCLLDSECNSRYRGTNLPKSPLNFATLDLAFTFLLKCTNCPILGLRASAVLRSESCDNESLDDIYIRVIG